MGLEITELQMDVEEQLSINIPVEDGSDLSTVRLLCLYIIEKKKEQGEVLELDDVFQRVKRIIEETGYAEDNTIELDSRFVEDLGFD